MFSFGVVLWELIHRQRPYADADVPVYILMMSLGSGTLRLPPPREEFCSQGLVRLLERCLAANATDRPCFREILHFLEIEYKVARGKAAAVPRSDSASSMVAVGAAAVAAGLGHAATDAQQQQHMQQQQLYHYQHQQGGGLGHARGALGPQQASLASAAIVASAARYPNAQQGAGLASPVDGGRGAAYHHNHTTSDPQFRAPVNMTGGVPHVPQLQLLPSQPLPPPQQQPAGLHSARSRLSKPSEPSPQQQQQGQAHQAGTASPGGPAKLRVSSAQQPGGGRPTGQRPPRPKALRSKSLPLPSFMWFNDPVSWLVGAWPAAGGAKGGQLGCIGLVRCAFYG